MEDLAMEVGLLDDIVIYEGEMTYPSASEIIDRRASNPTRSNDTNRGFRNYVLRLEAA